MKVNTHIAWLMIAMAWLMLPSCKPNLELDTESFVKYVGGAEHDQGVDMAQLTNGDYLLLATAGTFSGGNPRMTTILLDSAGNFKRADVHSSTNAWDLVAYDNGYLALGGSYWAGTRDFTLTHISPQGFASGTMTISIPDADEYEGELWVNAEGHIFVTGVSHFQNGARSMVIEYDGSLTEQRRIIYGPPNQQVATIGSRTMGGVLLSGGTIDNASSTDLDLYVQSANQSINKIWQYETSGDQVAVAMGRLSTDEVWVIANDNAQEISTPLLAYLRRGDLDDTWDTLPCVHLDALRGIHIRAMYMIDSISGAILIGENAEDDIAICALAPDLSTTVIDTIASSTPLSVSDVNRTADHGYAIIGSRVFNNHTHILVAKFNSNWGF